MLGTLYPLLLDALVLGKISVGPPYFETVFVPLIAPAIFLMGIGPLLRWKSSPLPELAVRLRWAAAASVLAALIVPFLMGRWSWMTAFGLLLAAWVISTVTFGIWQRRKDDGSNTGLKHRLRKPSLSFYGMPTAHLGIGIFIIGVTLVNGYQSEADVKMAPGEYATLAGNEFRFTGTREIQGPNYVAERGTIEVSRDGQKIATLHPEKRIYTAQNMPMTEAAINRGITRDLYVAMGEELSPPGTWIVRLWYKPFVNWIWIGCLIMALGGLLAASDRRYRVGKAQ